MIVFMLALVWWAYVTFSLTNFWAVLVVCGLCYSTQSSLYFFLIYSVMATRNETARMHCDEGPVQGEHTPSD